MRMFRVYVHFRRFILAVLLFMIIMPAHTARNVTTARREQDRFFWDRVAPLQKHQHRRHHTHIQHLFALVSPTASISAGPLASDARTTIVPPRRLWREPRADTI